jgi:hypothetical protein
MSFRAIAAAALVQVHKGLGESATYTSDGESWPVHVVLRQSWAQDFPDLLSRPGDGIYAADLLLEEVPDPAAGDVFLVDGTSYEVMDTLSKDAYSTRVRVRRDP